MILYLLRHGEAEPRAASDAERALTTRGLNELADVGQRLRDLKPRIDLCLVSPYLRARQSAQVLLDALGQKPRINGAPWLRPDESPQQALRLLDNLMARAMTSGDLLVVGHNPLLSALGGLLMHGTTQNMIGLDTAEILCIECQHAEPGQGRLRKHLRPLRA